MSTPSKIVQLLLGLIVPAAIATVWVWTTMQGFHLFRQPTAAEEAWIRLGVATGIVGYVSLALTCVLLRKRWPTFCTTAAIVGGLCGTIQLADIWL